MFNNYSEQQEILFKSLQVYRLEFDLEKINHDLKSFENSKIKKVMQEEDYKKLSSLKIRKIKEIEKLQKNAVSNSYDIIPKNQIKQAIIDLFGDDKYSIKKNTFAFRVMWDGNYSYKYNESLGVISKWLFEDEKRMNEIAKSIERFYKDICKRKLTQKQKIIIGASVVVTITTIAIGTTSVNGGLKGSGADFTKGSKILGLGDMRREPLVIALATPLLASCVGGTTYFIADRENNKKVFKNMTSNDIALSLALMCFMIEELKSKLQENELKEAFNQCMINVSTQKSELDYLLFVEQENVSENMKKLEMFHRFDNQVAKILELKKD